MGLIGENCRPCREAASADESRGGGLAGSWWRAWAKVRIIVEIHRSYKRNSLPHLQANDNLALIGAGIVGSFVAVVSGWYGARWLHGKVKSTPPV